MLSRVAENIYWMARNIERAENVARIAEVNHHLSLDSVIEQKKQWEPIVSIFGDEEPFYKHYDSADEASVLRYLFADRENPNSVIACLRCARENARGTRDQLSHEAWQQLNLLYLRCKDFEASGRVPDQQFFDEIKNGSHLFFGIMNDTMTHDEAYRWANLGRFLERADKTSRVIDVKYFILLPSAEYVGSQLDAVQWLAVLKSVSAAHMYLRQEPRIIPEKLISFLIQNESFPRSVAWCIKRARIELQHIIGDDDGDLIGRFEKFFQSVTAPPVTDILNAGLHQFIDQLQTDLNDLHSEIYARYFSLERRLSGVQFQKMSSDSQ